MASSACQCENLGSSVEVLIMKFGEPLYFTLQLKLLCYPDGRDASQKPTFQPTTPFFLLSNKVLWSSSSFGDGSKCWWSFPKQIPRTMLASKDGHQLLI